MVGQNIPAGRYSNAHSGILVFARGCEGCKFVEESSGVKPENNRINPWPLNSQSVLKLKPSSVSELSEHVPTSVTWRSPCREIRAFYITAEKYKRICWDTFVSVLLAAGRAAQTPEHNRLSSICKGKMGKMNRLSPTSSSKQFSAITQVGTSVQRRERSVAVEAAHGKIHLR